MAFNPLSLLVLTFRGRNVAVIRHCCTHYEVSRPCHCLSPFVHKFDCAAVAQNILPVAQRNFQTLQGVPLDDIIILASIPDYPVQGLVEISAEIWSMINDVVHSVTIALQSGASSVGLR